MTVFNIKCVFDINCPWCYIGHTYLNRALVSHKAAHPNDVFKISLEPFYLKPPPQLSDPSAPPFPVPIQSRQKLREETYGKSYANSVLENIQRASKVAGLNLKFNGPTGTTRNGHRLVLHAQQLGGFEKAESTLHDLFKRYHEEEVDITKLPVLTEVGVQNGLGNEKDVEEYLSSGADGQRVDYMAEQARRSHSGGVPWFEIRSDESKQSVAVDGAQDEAAWHDVFKRVAAKTSI